MRLAASLIFCALLPCAVGCSGSKGLSPSQIAREPAAGKDLEEKQAAGKEKIDRKIIQTADVNLTVSDFNKAEQELNQIVALHKCYYADSEIVGRSGSKRQGRWKIRVPVGQYSQVVEAVKKLGDLERYSSDAKDVTEEYYDLQNRIQNKESELAAVRKLFDKGSGKIEDILALQRELSRAQGELEQLKGRHKLLDNLTELTTLNVAMQERDAFTPTEPKTFGEIIAQTWDRSTSALVTTGKTAILIAVALAPWLPVFAALALAYWLGPRRWLAQPSPRQSPQPPKANPPSPAGGATPVA